MRLVRYNPFNELAFFGNSFNNFFNDSVSRARTEENWYPVVDILNEDDHITLNVELPGIAKEDISINIEDKVLSISGERKVEHEEKKDSYYRKERRFGSFKRSFTLSDEILTDEISADFENGVLKLTLKKDTAKEEIKQIPIN